MATGSSLLDMGKYIFLFLQMPTYSALSAGWMRRM